MSVIFQPYVSDKVRFPVGATNPSQDVSELNNTGRSPNLKALKLWQDQSRTLVSNFKHCFDLITTIKANISIQYKDRENGMKKKTLYVIASRPELDQNRALLGRSFSSKLGRLLPRPGWQRAVVSIIAFRQHLSPRDRWYRIFPSLSRRYRKFSRAFFSINLETKKS